MQLSLFTPMAKRNGRWIDGLRPDMPVGKAARKTLRRRLKAVWSSLKPAAEKPDGSTEYVHQLRVSTRRATAALEGYAELLPRRRAEKIAKQLKRVRRRAGRARDYDVLAERLSGGDDGDRLRPLVEKLGLLRREAQAPICEIYEKLRRDDFPRRIRKLVKRAAAPRDARDTTFAQWARRDLSRSVESFFEAGRGDFNDIAQLHRFRIEGKHLRYVLEYVVDAFGPELREELYPEVERIQSLLGIVNDHASALEHYETWRSEWNDPTLTRLLDERIAVERRALQEARLEFLRWWTPQRSTALRDRFAALLGMPDEEHAA